MKFIIEHLEQETYDWCMIEYEHISGIVGKQNLIFTNVKNKKSQNKLKNFGEVFDNNASGMKFQNICVLSQYANKTLEADDRDKFDYFLFGGILGDAPAKRRTIDIINELKKAKIKFEERNLGNIQMPTDVAVYVTKKILEGKKLNDLKFVDELEIEIGENESVVLPFRYVVDGNKVIVSEKLVEHLRKMEGF